MNATTIESALAVLYKRRNVKAHRAMTRSLIRKDVRALRAARGAS